MDIDKLQTSSTLSIEEELLKRGNRNELLKLISRLNVLDRDILVMKFMQSFSNEEIAINTGLAKSTIEDRIYHVLKKVTLA